MSEFSQECRKPGFRLDEYLNAKDKTDPGFYAAEKVDGPLHVTIEPLPG